MSQHTRPVRNLINGVSQQDPTIRLDNQVEEQINLTSDSTFGLIKRNSVDYLGKTKGTNFTDRIVYSFKQTVEGVENRYVILRPDFTSTEPREQELGIYNITKNIYTQVRKDISPVKSTPFLEYFKGAKKGDLVFEENQDNIYILNKAKTVMKEPDPVVSPSCKGLIWVNSALHRDYFYINVTLSNGGTPVTKSWQIAVGPTPGSGLDPDLYKVANEIMDEMNATVMSPGQPTFNCGFQGNVVFIRLSGGTGTWKVTQIDVTHSTSPSSVGSIIHAEDSPDFLPDPTALPIFNPNTYGIDFKARIQIDPRSSKTAYYLKNIEQGWVEDAKSSLPNSVDVDTFIHYISKNELNKIKTFDMIKRLSGDEESNPDPTFINKRINDMVLFNDRLGVATDSSLILSEIKNFNNFYKTTTALYKESDRVDVNLDSSKLNYSPIKNINIINGQLIINTGSSQALFSTTTGVNILESRLSPVSQYTLGDKKSISVGSTLVFATKYKDYILLNQYKVDEVTGATFITKVLNEHCSNYIPGTPRQMIYSNNILLLSTQEDKKTVFIHNRLLDGITLVKNSFSKLIFNEDVEYMDFVNNKLFIVFTNGDSTFFGDKEVFNTKKEVIDYKSYSSSTIEVPDMGSVVAGDMVLELFGEQVTITAFEFNNLSSFLTKINTFSFLNGVDKTISASKVGNKITITYNGFTSYSPLRFISSTFRTISTLPGWSGAVEDYGGDQYFTFTQVSDSDNNFYNEVKIFDGDTEVPVVTQWVPISINVGSLVFYSEGNERYSRGAFVTGNKWTFYYAYNLDSTYLRATIVENQEVINTPDSNAIDYKLFLDIPLDYVDETLGENSELIAVNPLTGHQYETIEEAQVSFEPVVYGLRYLSEVILSKQVLRFQAQNGFEVKYFGNLYLKRIRFSVNNTGVFEVIVDRVELDPSVQISKTHQLGTIPLDIVKPTDRIFQAYTNGNSKDLKITVRSNNAEPFNLIGYEWIAVVNSRGKRV